jgi:hypothetical protein
MSTTYPTQDSDRSWKRFSQYMACETGTTGYGRQALRRQWRNLRSLASTCSAKISDAEISGLLGKSRASLDPEKNDLKALVAYCVGKGIAEGRALIEALERDLTSEPMAFLAEHSGKSFGEKWAPVIAKYWLANREDHWNKMGAKDFYDIGWTPTETQREIRLELKASSEAPAFRFQQVRHPRLSGATSGYDIPLCLGVTASSLEWWVIPTRALGGIANNGTTASKRIVIRKHHGKDAPIWNNTAGYTDEGWFSTDERCRSILRPYQTTSENLLSLADLIDALSPVK